VRNDVSGGKDIYRRIALSSYRAFKVLCDIYFSPSANNKFNAMISAAFIWEPRIYNDEFNELNALIEAAAVSTLGFLGVQCWTSEDGKRNNATYYWESVECRKALTTHPKHIKAKRCYAE